MDGLDAPSFVELDPPTTRGRSSSDEKTLAVAVFWMARSPPCTHSDAITGRKRLLRFRQCVCCGAHVATFLYMHHHAGQTPMEVSRRLTQSLPGHIQHRNQENSDVSRGFSKRARVIVSFPKRAREGARTKSRPIAADHPCWARLSGTPIPVGSSRKSVSKRINRAFGTLSAMQSTSWPAGGGRFNRLRKALRADPRARSGLRSLSVHQPQGRS